MRDNLMKRVSLRLLAYFRGRGHPVRWPDPRHGAPQDLMLVPAVVEEHPSRGVHRKGGACRQ